jgi:hypothetical protein
MPVRIQFRRGTATQWAAANPTLAAGELGLETDTSKYKIGDGLTVWNSLSYSSLPVNALDLNAIDAKGDLIAGTADNTVGRVGVGSNNTVLIADSAQSAGIRWASTLSGLTLTSPVVNSPAISTGTITSSVVKSLEETWNISSTAASGTVLFNVLTSNAWFYTINATGNWTLNVRGDGSNTLNSLLAVGDSITVVFAVTNGATPYYQTGFQVDGSAVTPRWQGGSAPSSGNANSVDLYTFSIVKTAATPTYTVFGAQTQFA